MTDTKTEGRYFARNTDPRSELSRLRLLEQLFDPATIGGMERIGVGEGWCCLEVGAGAGSVTRWLSDRVGPDGLVVAADLDPRFLDGPQAPNIWVRTHDIVHDDLEPAQFDLVHCRHLLTHLTDDADAALTKMVAALRPGGWLFVEEADMTTMRSLDPIHVLSGSFDRGVTAFVESARREDIFDPSIGPTLPGRLTALGMTAVEATGTTSIEFGGDTPVARWYSMSAGVLQPLLVGRGYLDQTDADLRDAAYADPTFCFQTITTYHVSGCVPHADQRPHWFDEVALET